MGSVSGTSDAAVSTRGRRSLPLGPSLLLPIARRGPDATALPHLQVTNLINSGIVRVHARMHARTDRGLTSVRACMRP